MQISVRSWFDSMRPIGEAKATHTKRGVYMKVIKTRLRIEPVTHAHINHFINSTS